MGTPEFAVPTLDAIHNKYGVRAVVTIPDKPKGRGQKLSASPVKNYAVEKGIEIIQPISMKDLDFAERLKEINPDIIVVVAFRILPKEICSIANIASFNIHGSLLPKYRGAAPINYAILKNEKVSGVTSFILQEKVDTGNILLKKEIYLPYNCTAGDLHDLLMPISADCAVETIDLLLNGNYTPLKQDDTLASPAPKIFRENCKIDFNNKSEYLRCFVNHISPTPGSFTMFNDKILKILRVEVSEIKIEAGTFLIDEQNFYAGTNDFALKLTEIQLEGKSAVKVSDFIRGYRGIKKGSFN